jgi:prenyltransferase beta subunit
VLIAEKDAIVPTSVEKSRWQSYATTDGGASQQNGDLWCTYAAVRALKWLGQAPLDTTGAVAFVVERQNGDGGFAWQKGMRSDLWATYYCTQLLLDLNHPVPRLKHLASWLASLTSPDGGFSMTAGHPPDIWAVYYAARTYAELLNKRPANLGQVGHWLIKTQLPSGGLTWSPESTMPDTRACYYGAIAWDCLRPPPYRGAGWNVPALIKWIQNQQVAGEGFVFQPQQEEPCLWATFRATCALTALGKEPIDKKGCVRWIVSGHLPGTGFSRWHDYPIADVWACFSAVGALKALGIPVGDPIRQQVSRFLQSCQLPDNGFTYREPEAAGDSLATSALCILNTLLEKQHQHGASEEQRSRFAWLRRAHMPYEGGVMYMPARGAEVRCTLWALAALDLAGEPLLDEGRLLQWLMEVQNPDGGFGYWHGRGSDLTATISALECIAYMACPEGRVPIDWDALHGFLLSCKESSGVRFAPRGEVSLNTTCQGIRGLWLLDEREGANYLADQIPGFASKLGGYSNESAGLPNLTSTYQVILTLQQLRRPWDVTAVEKLLSRTRRSGNGYAWSPLGREQEGPLATCLGTLLEYALTAVQSGQEFLLPRLNL